MHRPYSLDRRRTGPDRRSLNAKLHRAEVQEIRTWAQSEGAGLPRAVQVEMLQARYPGLAERTLVDVLLNRSWYDPRYDPNAIAEPDSTLVATWLLQAPWLLHLILLFKLLHPAKPAAAPAALTKVRIA